MKQPSIAAAEFKNACFKVMNDVHDHGTPVTITKRGKPLVQIIPIKEVIRRRSLLGSITHEAKDIFSTNESWEADA